MTSVRVRVNIRLRLCYQMDSETMWMVTREALEGPEDKKDIRWVSISGAWGKIKRLHPPLSKSNYSERRLHFLGVGVKSEESPLFKMSNFAE